MNGPALSPECLAVLESFEVNAELSGAPARPTFTLRDTDGGYICVVSGQIGAGDLLSILLHGQRERMRGQREGRVALQTHLRQMLNAAPLEPSE